MYVRFVWMHAMLCYVLRCVSCVPRLCSNVSLYSRRLCMHVRNCVRYVYVLWMRVMYDAFVCNVLCVCVLSMYVCLYVCNVYYERYVCMDLCMYVCYVLSVCFLRYVCTLCT